MLHGNKVYSEIAHKNTALMLDTKDFNNFTSVFETISYDSDSGFEGSAPSSPFSGTNSESFGSLEPDEENFQLSVGNTLCLPNFNTMDYCSIFSDISDNNCLGAMDFLFEDNLTTLHRNERSQDHNLLWDAMDFDLSFDDLSAGVEAPDSFLIDIEDKDLGLNSEETIVLDNKKELNSIGFDDSIEPEVTNSHRSKGGFPGSPVEPTSDKDNDNSKTSRNFLKQIVRLDHCYCKALENCNTKSSTPVSIGLDRDQSYWQRRNRNNAAARRSREAKRARDIEMWKRAQSLESENAQLRIELKELMANVERNEKKLRFYRRS